jgi:DNA polymerase III gamma/tau subunit
MNKQLLIHKYSPKHLDEFIGNNEVKLFLKNMIQCNCISFILLGSQGYGKTSFLEAFVNDYFKSHNITNFHNSVLYINQFKEQGIHFFKNEVN